LKRRESKTRHRQTKNSLATGRGVNMELVLDKVALVGRSH
jgi:hypothetical protein